MHGQEPLWRDFLNSNCSAVLNTNSFKGCLIVYSLFIWRWYYWQWKAAKDGVPLLLKLVPGIFIFLEKLIFLRENYMISSVFSVLSYDITCMAHTFHINGICNKTHGRVTLINTYSNRHLTPPLHLQPWEYISAREYIFLSCAPCAYRYNKEKF